MSKSAAEDNNIYLFMVQFTLSLLFLAATAPTSQNARTKRRNEQVKGKAIPVQARTGPEGSRRLRLPHYKTIGT
jgi:hypothetical protein